MNEKRKKGGRPKKEGLEYYPLYASLYDTKKMRMAEDLIDPGGMDMMRRLLVDKFVTRFYSTIFLRGYYMHWNDEEEQDLCNKMRNGMNTRLLRPYLEAMLNVGFLDKEMYLKYNILTSRGIQQKWLKISKLIRRDKPTIEERFFIVSDKNEFLRDGKPVSSRRNYNNLQKKHANNTVSTDINTHNNNNIGVNSEETPIPSVRNTDTLREETIVSLSTTTNHSLLDNKDNIVVVGNVPEETGINSGTNANNSQFSTENTGIGGSFLGNKGEFVREETNDSSVRNPMIPSNSQLTYPIETCQWNYLYNKASEKTREQHQINWGLMLDHDGLEAWTNAFNRSLINDGVFERQFNGREGWLRHLRHWLTNINGYQSIDPNNLFTEKDIKNANKRTGNQPAANNSPDTAKQKLGGVSAKSVTDLLNRKKKSGNS